MTEEIVKQPLETKFIIQGVCPRCLQQSLTDRNELSRWLGKTRLADCIVFTCTNDECRALFRVPRRFLSR